MAAVLLAVIAFSFKHCLMPATNAGLWRSPHSFPRMSKREGLGGTVSATRGVLGLVGDAAVSVSHSVEAGYEKVSRTYH